MSILPNVKHELFAQALAKGSKQHEAYLGSGMSAANAHSNASRLANKPHIVARVHELLSDVAMITKVDKSWIMTNLQKVYETAFETGDLSTCNKSLELMGKELGMFRDKLDVDVQVSRRLIVERLTDEKAAILTSIVREIEGGNDGG